MGDRVKRFPRTFTARKVKSDYYILIPDVILSDLAYTPDGNIREDDDPQPILTKIFEYTAPEEPAAGFLLFSNTEIQDDRFKPVGTKRFYKIYDEGPENHKKFRIPDSASKQETFKENMYMFFIKYHGVTNRGASTTYVVSEQQLVNYLQSCTSRVIDEIKESPTSEENKNFLIRWKVIQSLQDLIIASFTTSEQFAAPYLDPDHPWYADEYAMDENAADKIWFDKITQLDGISSINPDDMSSDDVIGKSWSSAVRNVGSLMSDTEPIGDKITPIYAEPVNYISVVCMLNVHRPLPIDFK